MQKNDWDLPKHYGRGLNYELYLSIEKSKRKLRLRKNIVRVFCAVVVLMAVVMMGF